MIHARQFFLNVFRGVREVWSSPAVRCRGLAEAIAAVLRVPLREDQRLWELDFGAWEGRPWETIAREDLDRWALDPLGFAPPGGDDTFPPPRQDRRGIART